MLFQKFDKTKNRFAVQNFDNLTFDFIKFFAQRINKISKVQRNKK
jgi:hypothetical protein